MTAVVKSAGTLLPSAVSKEKAAETETEAEKYPAAEEAPPDRATVSAEIYTTPKDVQALIDAAKKNADRDKRDGGIIEKQYANEGVTDSFGAVRIKNVNKTKIDVQKLLSERADLSVSEDKPSVLIFHTHTTESYQTLDRGFYPVGSTSRSRDEKTNMIRVGDAVCAQLEKAGVKYIHDREIHDLKYNGAYDRSRKTAVEILKKYPSIQVVLDVHRDAIQQTNGVKIKPTAKIGERKAAQIMIISGCQEEGNGVTDFPDWRHNLVFAVQLHRSLEEMFPGLMRPMFFCPRKYNMNLTRCSLLVEVGSDANTLDEAVYSGDCLGRALAKMLAEYT